MAYNFTGKKVWITGASSGIGLHLAKRLLQANAIVAVTARSTERLESEFSHIQNAFIFPADIISQQNNDRVVAQINSILGGLDCVIFNAGTAEYVDVKNFSATPFEQMIETNYLSMVRGISAALPLLRISTDAYLIGMSSSVAWHGLPRGYAYSASKAAIRNLLQGLKIELAREKIAVSWICPGFVKTPLTDKNDFDMPQRIDAQRAADIIFRNLCRQTSEIHFPKTFTLLLKSISMLPASWAARLLKKTAKNS